MGKTARVPRYVSDSMVVLDLQAHGASTRAQIVERHPSWAQLNINNVLKRCKRKGHIVNKGKLWMAALPAGHVRLPSKWSTQRPLIVRQVSEPTTGYVVVEPVELAEHLDGRVLPSRDAVYWECEHLLSKGWSNPGRNKYLTTGWG